MSAIGVRSSTNEIHYAIIKGSVVEPELIQYNKLSFPKAYTPPQALSWIREQFGNIKHQFNIQSLFVRTIEPIARVSNKAIFERALIEGVLIEAANTFGIKVNYGPLATMSSLLETKAARHYMTADEFRGIDNWKKINEKYKEACISALCALSMLEA